MRLKTCFKTCLKLGSRWSASLTISTWSWSMKESAHCREFLCTEPNCYLANVFLNLTMSWMDWRIKWNRRSCKRHLILVNWICKLQAKKNNWTCHKKPSNQSWMITRLFQISPISTLPRMFQSNCSFNLKIKKVPKNMVDTPDRNQALCRPRIETTSRWLLKIKY